MNANPLGMSMQFHHLRFALACSLALVSAPAAALDYSWDISTEVEHESNATRTENEKSGTLTAVGTRFNFNHAEQAFTVSGNYGLSYDAYLNDTNEDRFDADGNSALDWQITDKLLAWQFFHQVSSTVVNRGANSTDPTLVDVADNRRTRNQIATGPVINLPITSVDSVILSGSYQEVRFENAENDALNDTDPDSESRIGGASWVHQLSSTSSINLGYNYNEVERKDSTLSNSETIFETAYLGYTQQLNRNSYLLRLGSNRSKPKGEEDNSGFYYLGEYAHDFGSQQLSVSASQQKTSTAFGSYGSSLASFNASNSNAINLSQSNYEINDIVEITSVEIDYRSTMNCSRCEYGVRLSHIGNDYEELTDENDSTNLILLSYKHRLRHNLNGKVHMRHLRRNFDASNNDNSDTEIGIDFDYQYNKRLSFYAGAGFMTRDSDRANDSEYDNISVFAGVSYNLMDSSRN